MPFVAACPFCPTKVRLPENALGASICCPKCGNHFTAAPQESLFASATSYRLGRTRRVAGLVPNPSPAPVTSPGCQRQEPLREVPVTENATAATAAGTAAFIPEPRPANGINEWGAVAILLAGGGLAAALLASRAAGLAFLSQLAIPLAGLGLLVCLVGYWASDGCRQTRDIAWLGLGGTVSFAALLAAVLWIRPALPQHNVNLALDDPDPHQFLLVTLDNRQMIKDLGRSEWANAEKESLRQGAVHIRIVWAKLAAPPLKKTTQQVALPKSLLIQVQIHAGQALQYHGLQTLAQPPALVDDRGTSYPLRKFTPELGVVDPVGRTAMRGGERVQELLMFEPPAPDCEAVKLELPAAGWGGTGTCRFRIPRSMIASANRP